MRDKDIEPFLAQRGEEHGSGLGIYRWVSERTIGWLLTFVAFAPALIEAQQFTKRSSH